jgi:23S rRNA pseudouridine1911/1915/1917 synthase
MVFDDDDIDERIALVVPEIPPGTKPPRLDTYLVGQMEDVSRTRIQKLIEEGRVLVDSLPAKTSHRIAAGEKIDIALPSPQEIDLIAEDIPLNVIFEDDHLAVINKPAGMVTHPGAGVDSGTLVNALLHHMRGTLSGIGGVLRPGIVHRLDKDTSGLLVVAKDDVSHRHLADQIQKKSARRLYVALVAGHLEKLEGTIDRPIGRHPTKRKEMAVLETGKKAISHYRLVEKLSRCSLVEVELETGRTHQIRVHMASIGHPVVGDLIYNKGLTGSQYARKKLGLVGQALHSARLSFIHPQRNCLLEFSAPLPADFANALMALR